MTKLRWEKADQYPLDPGAVVEVPEITTPSRWIGPQEQEKRRIERAKRNRELKRKSEEHDLELRNRQLLRRIQAKLDRGEELSGLERLFMYHHAGMPL